MNAQKKMTIRQGNVPVAVQEGQTLLEAALQAGVSYPYSCKSGRCGACKSRLIEGQVRMDPHSRFALSADEQKSGLILACRAHAVSEEVTVAWIGEDLPIEPPQVAMSAEIVSKSQLTHEIVALRLRPERPVTFLAGQFARLKFGDLPERSYSMANNPDEPMLEFHIRRMSDGYVSRHVFERAMPGDRVGLEGPSGTSYLREAHTGPIIAVAGGSGLAPMQAIVERALALGIRQPIRLYLGARTMRDLYHVDRFKAHEQRYPNFSFRTVLSEETTDSHRRGYVGEAALEDLPDLPGAQEAKLYAAGPPPMVESLLQSFKSRGYPEENIHADAFYSEAVLEGRSQP